jgi:hypothetical protein
MQSLIVIYQYSGETCLEKIGCCIEGWLRGGIIPAATGGSATLT